MQTATYVQGLNIVASLRYHLEILEWLDDETPENYRWLRDAVWENYLLYVNIVIRVVAIIVTATVCTALITSDFDTYVIRPAISTTDIVCRAHVYSDKDIAMYTYQNERYSVSLEDIGYNGDVADIDLIFSGDGTFESWRAHKEDKKEETLNVAFIIFYIAIALSAVAAMLIIRFTYLKRRAKLWLFYLEWANNAGDKPLIEDWIKYYERLWDR